jgi:hypothetical protein
MTQLLRKAFEEASRLPEDEQDSLAGWLLQELESERRWSEQFARSADVLEKLGAEALQEADAGLVEGLDPDKL